LPIESIHPLFKNGSFRHGILLPDPFICKTTAVIYGPRPQYSQNRPAAKSEKNCQNVHSFHPEKQALASRARKSHDNRPAWGDFF
jgi:hypothetical protein